MSILHGRPKECQPLHGAARRRTVIAPCLGQGVGGKVVIISPGSFLETLRREGLLDTRATTPPRRRWYALAAGLAVATIALPLAIGLLRDAPETPEHLITRGGIAPPQRIEAAAPQAAAAELAAGLRAAGAIVGFDPQASPLRLTVTVPEDRRAASADFLARHGLTLPAPGRPLRILVVPKPDDSAPRTSNRAPDPRNGDSR